jgi:hypothetical protein
MLRSSRFTRFDATKSLLWDGHALQGQSFAQAITVLVPARLISFRLEAFPPAPEMVIKAAARLKAERIFSALGPVCIDAIVQNARENRCLVVLMALPKNTVEQIKKAAAVHGKSVRKIQVAELVQDIPVGGLQLCGEDACLIQCEQGHITAIAALGLQGAANYATQLSRERLRLNISDTMPGMPAPGLHIDFLHPHVAAPPPLFQRSGVRLSLLAAGVVLIIALAITFAVGDAISARDNALAEAKKLAPLAQALAARRSDMKEIGLWLAERPSLAPEMHAVTQALPAGEAKEQIRLVRVRQSFGEDTIVEASASDRSAMLAFIARLRADERIAFAEARSSRSPSKESQQVIFELVLRLEQNTPKTDKIPGTTQARPVSPKKTTFVAGVPRAET